VPDKLFQAIFVKAGGVSELKKLISNGNYGVKYTVDKLLAVLEEEGGVPGGTGHLSIPVTNLLSN
jgi:hypothetical protein